VPEQTDFSHRSFFGEAQTSPFQRERIRRAVAEREQSVTTQYKRILAIRKRQGW
jgi:hypothetical protein